MAPRKASTAAKAAPAPKKLAAAKADKAAAPLKATATATKRKRTADDDEPAAKTNGVNGVNGTKAAKGVNGVADDEPKQLAKRAKKEPTPTPRAAKAARAKLPTDANKENAVPAVNGTKAGKRAKSATPAPAAPPKAKANTAAKRKADEKPAEADAQKAAPAPAPAKKAKAETAAPAAAVPARKPAGKIGVKINDAPTAVLDVFVFGEGGAGELGLGNVRLEGKKPMDVKRPRLNPKLAASKVGVVQVAAGGMHAVALTKDNKILTWGVNDQGALGRDTTWSGGQRSADDDGSDSEDDEDDTGLNPLESTPAEVDTADVVPGTRFVQVVASDSASFALTEDGRVYGWGTFRASDGILGFSRTVQVQQTPVLLPEPKKVKALATGSNHILALDAKGKLFTWGCPEQNQLGRRCVQRDIKESALRPGGVGFKRGVHVAKIACGSYHSFALDSQGQVYAWGLNNFGQLSAAEGGGAGDSDATVLDATLVAGLAGQRVADIDGGEHHSVACTEDGRLFAWGRIDGHQVGLPDTAFTADNAIFDEYGKPRILKAPTAVPGVPASVVQVSAGTDNSFALTRDGKVYSWGFSANYQTGQGTTDDVEVPTLIDNTAVRGKKLVFADAGGQYSILASVAE